MSEQGLVSIIVPVYNIENYLSRCLESIAVQTYQNLEIILVDDGSTDNSSILCDKFVEKDSRTKVIHQENIGQLVSRCNGVKKSSGDYCLFVDSDDIVVNNALQIIKDVIKRYAFPDAILFPFFYEKNGKRTISKAFNECDRYYSKEEIKEVRELFFTTSIMDSMCTKAIKRSVLIKSIYDTQNYEYLRCSEDRLQAMWAFDNVNTVAYINCPLYIYRLFEGSTTRNFSYDSIEKNKTVSLYLAEKAYLKKWGFNSVEWSQRFDSCWITYMLYVFLLFYTECSRTERKKVLSYDWKTFIPEQVDDLDVISNRYINKEKKQLYLCIIEKKANQINSYVLKRKFRMKYKTIKQKLFNHR